MHPSRPLDTRCTLIAHANLYQFAVGERVHHPQVGSRMFLWCKSGSGSVTVNGTRCDLVANAFLLLPWNHEVIYQADGRDPFFVGGIHIIPFEKRGRTVRFEVSHRPVPKSAASRLRKDVPWPTLPGLIRGTLHEGRLAWLASYIVDAFHHVGPEEQAMRMLGQLLVGEIVLATLAGRANALPIPASLQRMSEYARAHLAGSLAVEDLAEIGECSVASVHRQFRRFLRNTPRKFIASLRIEKAKLLLRTTTLPVSHVGMQVGFADPFHFSRFYKAQTGQAPRTYRQRASIL